MKKRLLSALLVLCVVIQLCGIVQAAPVTFSDVGPSHWAHSYISRAATEGLVNGTGDGTFQPERNVTYSEWFTMLTRLFYQAELENYTGSTTYWWEPYISVAAKHDLVRGTAFQVPTTTAAYNADVGAAETVMNRYQMAATMYYLLQDTERKSGTELLNGAVTAQAEAALKDFSGMERVNQWAVSVTFGRGFILGTDKGIFDGTMSMSRAQAATVLCRLSDYRTGGSPPPPTPTPTPTPSPTPTPPMSGTLANGRAITDENILEILAELEKEYPDGTPWGEDKYYASPKLGYGGGCIAWAYMVSDRIFGEDTAYQTHTNIDNIRIGDVVWIRSKDNPANQHYFVVASNIETVVVPNVGSYERFSSSDGNSNGKVSWSPNSRYIHTLKNNYTFTIYTRYPA